MTLYEPVMGIIYIAYLQIILIRNQAHGTKINKRESWQIAFLCSQGEKTRSLADKHICTILHLQIMVKYGNVLLVLRDTFVWLR